MQTFPLVPGRQLLLVLEPGDEVLASIAEGCRAAGIRQAGISTFLGAFRSVRLIASTHPPADPEAASPDVVEVTYSEGVGSGTVTTEGDAIAVHLHVAVGEKADAGRAVAGHVVSAETHYVAEVVVTEIIGPDLYRAPRPGSSGVPTLSAR
jgi:predicted DNA-binding protein with PD1-like motif